MEVYHLVWCKMSPASVRSPCRREWVNRLVCDKEKTSLSGGWASVALETFECLIETPSPNVCSICDGKFLGPWGIIFCSRSLHTATSGGQLLHRGSFARRIQSICRCLPRRCLTLNGWRIRAMSHKPWACGQLCGKVFNAAPPTLCTSTCRATVTQRMVDNCVDLDTNGNRSF